MRALRGPMKTREARYALSARNSCVLPELGELDDIMTFRESIIASWNGREIAGIGRGAEDQADEDAGRQHAPEMKLGHASLPQKIDLCLRSLSMRRLSFSIALLTSHSAAARHLSAILKIASRTTDHPQKLDERSERGLRKL